MFLSADAALQILARRPGKLVIFKVKEITFPFPIIAAIFPLPIIAATNKGNIRSAISIFPHLTEENRAYRVWNSQFIKYAGYKNSDGTITGDPSSIEITEVRLKHWKKTHRQTGWIRTLEVNLLTVLSLISAPGACKIEMKNSNFSVFL